MFKAVFSDLDGTIINSNGEVTFKTLEAIKKFRVIVSSLLFYLAEDIRK